MTPCNKPTRRPARLVCFWKGVASYYTIETGGRTSKHAAWTYRRPFPWIRKIRGHVAFWDGVEVTD